MSRRLAAGTVFMLCGLLSFAALADGECKAIFDDIGDHLTLGPIALGTDARTFMSDEEKKECLSDIGGEDCFAEKDNLSYIFGRNSYVVGVVEARDRSVAGIGTSVEMLETSPYLGKMIAGIQFSDTLDDVRRKLKSLPAGFPEWRQKRNEHGVYLYTDACLRGTNGDIWYYTLGFALNLRLDYVGVQREDFDRDM